MSDEKSYGILADGFSRIKIASFNPEIFKTSDEETARLDAYVKEQQERAAAKGGSFFDGNLIGVDMNSIKANGSTLEVGLKGMKYSQHAGSFRLNPNAPMQAIYINALLITADNKLVFGTTQWTEANWMGKLGIPAGGVEVGPDGFPSLGSQMYRELAEEVGVTADYHLDMKRVVPGWVNAKSTREGNYHLTTSFVMPLKASSAEFREYFAGWSAATEKMTAAISARTGKTTKPELKNVMFLDNDPDFIRQYLKEQDELGSNAKLLGKTADVVDEWARTYDCSLDKLVQSKEKGARVYLPQ